MSCCLVEALGPAPWYSSAIDGYGTSASNLSPATRPAGIANTRVDFRDVTPANVMKQCFSSLNAYEDKLVYPDHFTNFPARRGSSVCARTPKNEAKRSHPGRSSQRRTRRSLCDQARRAISVQERRRGLR